MRSPGCPDRKRSGCRHAQRDEYVRPWGGGGRPHAEERGLGRASRPTPGSQTPGLWRRGEVTCCSSTWSGDLFVGFQQDEHAYWSLWVADVYSLVRRQSALLLVTVSFGSRASLVGTTPRPSVREQLLSCAPLSRTSVACAD